MTSPLVQIQRPTLHFGRIVVIGGGCYGSWYLQQLTRAFHKGALVAREIVVVDRDPACRVAQSIFSSGASELPIRLVCSEWDAYLEEWLQAEPEDVAQDAMVPSPLMPHLCLDWLMARARRRWPDRRIAVEPLPTTPPTPWERAAPDGRHYVSFATWMCPVNCIEPARCPETRGERDWSLPTTLQRFVGDNPALDGSVTFHCVHRTYGVGMIDALAIVHADRQIAHWGEAESCKILVGTVSHCHGALGVLVVE